MSAHIFRFERQRFKNFMVISSWNSPDFSEVRAFRVWVKELAAPAISVPVLIVTFDHTRHQVEYYHFDRLQAEIALDDADFDPMRLWKK